MNEEAQKRNTDCVYFLASPLTCKKGNECEYRHSEAARINPRDCYFWLNGNCLNANCSFRHPPLDGRPATTQVSAPLQAASTTSAAATSVAAPSSVSKPTSAPTGASKPVAALSTASKPVQAPVIANKSGAAPPAASKSKTPCFFFSQGYCAKGDRCQFLHSQPAAPSIEAAVYKKPPKAPVAKGIESDKPVTLIRGNSSSTNRETLQAMPFTSDRKSLSQIESQSAPSKAIAAVREVSQLPNDGERGRISDTSVTSGPARHNLAIGDGKTRQSRSLGDKSRTSQTVVDRAKQAQPAENRLHQPHPGSQSHWQLQPTEKGRQALSREEKKQNGFESDEWWKQSSSTGLDVLTDRGQDRLIFSGDGADVPYHNADSMKNRSGGRMMRSDDMAEFDYNAAQNYDQSGYYASLGQHDQGPHGFQEQGLVREHRSNLDRIVGQQSLPFKSRPNEGPLPRDRRGILVEQEMQHGSGDLRDHLSKRRRNDRSQQLTTESSSRKITPETVNYHKRRHQDEHSKLEVAMLNPAPSHQGIKSNHRRSSGRGDLVGIRRAHHDIGSDYGSVSPDRVSSRGSPVRRPVNDPSRLKLKDTDSGWYAPDIALASEAEGYVASNSKKAEQKKEASNFAGPKSLAQIKAEKRRAEAENGFKDVERFDGPKGIPGTVNFPDQLPLMVIKSQISSASDSDVVQVHKAILSEETNFNLSNDYSNSQAFEGPKSLSYILKENQNSEAEGDDGVEETMKEAEPKGTSPNSGVGQGKGEVPREFLSLDISKVVEDGEVLPDTENLVTSSSEVVNGTKQNNFDSPAQDLSEIPKHAPGSISYTKKGEIAENVQSIQVETVKEELPFDEDMLDEGIEAGTNASDEEFSFDDDDDDDDDFAKKLGGFFPKTS